MAKVQVKPTDDLYPIPTVLVTVQEEGKEPNIITISWTGILNSTPFLVYIAVAPERYSYPMLRKTGEFVINIPSEDLWKVSDYCGFISGREVDKFKETGLTKIPATHVKAPLIKECPVNLECKVIDFMTLPSNDIFIAEVIAAHYDEEVLDEKGLPDIGKVKPFSYCLGDYRATGQSLGLYGETGGKFWK